MPEPVCPSKRPFPSRAVVLALGLAVALPWAPGPGARAEAAEAPPTQSQTEAQRPALSVTLTASSTLLAVVLTPALTWLYAGRTVPVPVGEMLLGIVQVVLAPVALGVLLNRWLGRRLDTVRAVFPAFSVSAICLIIAIVVAMNRDQIGRLAVAAVAVVMLHNLIGLAAGYWAARWLGYGEAVCRTIAIEVGMQNSGLAAALATKYFSAAAALPAAVFSVWHNLSGASLAAHWVRRDQVARAAVRRAVDG
jgi:BASS family bile acid:Na+ symporter